MDHRWVAENWLVDAASVRELPAEEKGVRFFNRARYRSRLSVQRSVVSGLLPPVLRLSRLCGSPDLAMDPDAFKDPEGEQDQHQK